MRLKRTKFAYEEAKSHIELAPKNDLISSFITQYLIVSFYSEVEEKVKEIISNRISYIPDARVATFVTKANEGMLKRIKKTEINDVLKMFGCGEGDILSQKIPDINLQPYHDIITNRHLVSHSNGSNLTIESIGKALTCADAILNALEATLASEIPTETPP